MSEEEFKDINNTEYNDMTSNYAEAREYCTECKTPSGKLKTLQIEIPGEGKFMLVATSCDNCPNKTSQMLPMTQLDIKNINIRGVINSLDDLYRYVYISGGSKVVFFIETFIYEFGCSNDIVGTLEILLFNAVDDISSAYEFSKFTTNTGADKTEIKDLLEEGEETFNASFSRENLESKLQLVSSSEDLTERKKIKRLLETLKKHIQNPNFIIEISDEQGTSRICPKNKLMSDCNFANLLTYNDENIVHKFTK